MAQLVRAPPCHGGGRGFEPLPGRLLASIPVLMKQVYKIGVLAQLGEHLPYKQRVTGSSPVGPIFYADVAQLAEQLICNQQVIGSSPIIGFDGILAQSVEHLTFNQVVRGSNPRCLITNKKVVFPYKIKEKRLFCFCHFFLFSEILDFHITENHISYTQNVHLSMFKTPIIVYNTYKVKWTETRFGDILMRMKKRSDFSTTQLIMLSFLIAVLIGSVLLALPVCAAGENAVPYIDALFTATTSVCVTGLVTVPTVSTWSIWGQAVILILIQIGGLGVITIISAFMINFHKRIGLGDRMLIQAAFNLDTLSGLVKFIKKVVAGTFIIEAIGAVLYMFVFVPEYGARGVWISVFNSVSAFCNAGIDILAENSLCGYVHNPLVNCVTEALIILGGIGYIVWWDVLRVMERVKKQKMKCFRNLTLHSKIVLSVTAALIVGGAVFFFVFEYSNPLTMKDYTLAEKIQASIFQSVTTRTAGFATIPQENLTNASAMVALLLMFIGGSPAGTAGGIKTVTIAVLFFSALATIRGNDEVVFFDRNIPKDAISKAVAVTSISFLTMFCSTVLLAAVTDAGALDLLYETVSATATVGLTRNLTSSLNLWGKIIMIITMYLGRVGPISLVIAFNMKKGRKNIIHNPTENIIVG